MTDFGLEMARERARALDAWWLLNIDPRRKKA
jgi:hypothetical protein